MVHENFIKKIEQESAEFKALMKVLSPLNTNAEKGRKLLCLVNHILDFYILRELESDDDVKMPIIYFPLCEEWAQYLCEEFVALKMTLLWGEATRTKLYTEYRCKPFVYLPEGASKKEQAALTKQFKFRRDVTKYITEDVLSYPCKDNDKCFLYCCNLSDEYKLTEKTKGHYHFCSDVFGTTISSLQSMILLGDNENDVYDAIEDNDGKIKVPNIILFLQKDMDGRNTPLCMQMQRSTINEYNADYDTGVQNVFSFIFSQKPYRLQRIFENKHNLVERLQREKVSETRDFISFTKEEMDLIFGREKASISIFDIEYEEGSEQHQIKNAFDFILQDISHEVKLRNELAICFTDESRSQIKEEILGQYSEINDYVDYYLQLLRNTSDNLISNRLYEWINFHQIAVVLDYNVDQFYKNQLEAYLINECGAVCVKFYSFKNFKGHKDGAIYLNSIKENKILVLSMLNHCTGKNWAIYPNSFDQYHLNPGQTVLQINNKIVFDPRYSWYRYRYVEQQKLLLNSDYRTKYVKNGIKLPEKPINIGAEPKEDEDEQNIRSRQSGREQISCFIWPSST